MKRRVKKKIEPKEIEIEIEKELSEYKKSTNIKKNRIKILIWVGFIIIFLPLFIIFRWDKVVFGIAVVIVGLLSQGINILFGFTSSIPVVGPVFVKFIALPIVLIMNTLGNLLSFFGLKLGYKKELTQARTLTLTFLTGFFLGYLLRELLK
uniref:Uncharacterized protein n=1 Tax=candidate division WOR-3 bacterium TaxID=2052148 RepID=A0A7C4U7F5_UNCW3